LDNEATYSSQNVYLPKRLHIYSFKIPKTKFSDTIVAHSVQKQPDKKNG